MRVHHHSKSPVIEYISINVDTTPSLPDTDTVIRDIGKGASGNAYIV